MTPEKLDTLVKDSIQRAQVNQDLKLFSKILDFARFKLGYNYDQLVSLYAKNGLTADDFEQFCYWSDSEEAHE